MTQDNRTIIAEPILASPRVAAALLVAAIILGTAAAVFYAHAHLTLSHYDARAHLVVARRVTDSLTPGWRQIGAVWLPLPHVIGILPLQSDWAYRTGYPMVAVSILSLALGLALAGTYLARVTRSRAAALVGPAVILANPNVLYLQSTPMTEPLLIGLSLAALAAVDAWCRQSTPDRRRVAGGVLFLLTLTRYEGWCIAMTLVALAALVRWRAREPGVFALAPYVVSAVVLFVALSRASTGEWFVSSGFFVPDNPALSHPLEALRQVVASLADLSSHTLLMVAAVGVLLVLAAAARSVTALLPLSLLSAGALPLFAFVQGHPLRVRYMVPLVAASGIMAAFAVASVPRRARGVAAAVLLVVTCLERSPIDSHAPMVTEAQWETPFRLGRQEVTRYLAGVYDGTPILASMGSLGHYMQEASGGGLNIRNFVHEGNGDLWQAATRAPRRYVNWVLIEERAEGGDMLAARAHEDANFLDGFTRAASGGGLVLYRKILDVSDAKLEPDEK
ncbi:MAG: hypothetical protein ABI051_08485 [Vicinamibacterales bacterium]